MKVQPSKLSFVTTVLLFLVLSHSSNAFTSTIRHSHLILPHSRHYNILPATTPPTILHATRNDSSSHSHAPSYEKIDATLTQAEPLADGSTMLHIRASRPVDYYQPGHVLALEIEDGSPSVDADDDTVANDGWMRGPYTVSRCRGCDVDVLIKTVGKKSKTMAAASPGTAFRVGGRFKVPILEGLARREDLKRVVMIATGVGIGPCVGAIEKALEGDEDVDYPPVELIASFREDDEVIYRDHLRALVEKYGENRLRFRYVVTSRDGRLSCSDDMLESLLFSDETNESNEWTVDDTHYHLIGNGQMVNEFKAGLSKALVPEDRVTIEQYFNHKADVSDDVIDRIAAVVSKKTSVVSPVR